MRRREYGFTLLELLIVVAIIGILASIAIPNLLTAIQRSRQKRSMVDMRNLATAWEARNVEAGRYNAAAAGLPGCDKPVLLTDLQTALAPTYIRDMPTLDGWGHAFELFTDLDWAAGANASRYVIWSAAKDGLFQSTPPTGATTSFDCDIIYSNGAFLQYPDGVGSSK